jgi:hypothetical protein
MRDETYDPSQRIVPNALPHIHASSTGKRYCDHCGQPMLENALTRPQDVYKGNMALPVLRSRSNLETPYISEGVVSAQVVAVAVGFVDALAPLTRTQDLQIGQLPKGSTRAHINIRDIAVIGTPVAGAITVFNGFVYYTDIQSKKHLICALTFNASAVPQVFNVWADTLIVESPITDGAPPNLGIFSVEVLSITLGAATSLTVDIRANLSVMFEV